MILNKQTAKRMGRISRILIPLDKDRFPGLPNYETACISIT